MRHVLIITGIVVLVAIGGVWAGVELRLYDGQVLRGTEVRRDGDFYILQLETGNVVSFPVPLVREVALVEDIADQPPPERLHPALVPGTPQQLEGQSVRPPTPAEQTAAIGAPSKFQKSIVDNEWHPTSDWSNDPAQNNFAPSKWSESIIDNEWQPKSAYDSDPAQNNFAPSTFSKGVVDNSWQPTDGFKK